MDDKGFDFKSPSATFTYDVNKNTMFKKDAYNYINELSIKQLNTLGNTSLLDIFLSTGNIVEPHIHQNASELVYCISGSAVVSLINPFTNRLLNFPITPGQVANIPQGWWHYEIATVDNTHLLAIFDAPVPETIFGSDILRLTPTNVLAHTYCLNEALVKEALAPIKDTVVIGPPAGCKPQMAAAGAVAGAHGAVASQQHPSHMHQGGYGQPYMQPGQMPASMPVQMPAAALYPQAQQQQPYYYPQQGYAKHW